MLYTVLDIRIQEAQDLVPLFLIASYTYYQRKENLMSDETFDLLAERLLKEWDDIVHPHKHLITKEHLHTQSGYNIEYPQDLIQEATKLLLELKGDT